MSKNHSDDVAFIEALAALLKKNDLTEVEVRREYGEDNTLEVRVSRQGTVLPVAAAPAPAPAPAPAVPATPATPAAPAASAAAASDDDPALDPGAVTSPMVGTAYLQAEPGSPAFVKIGDQVSEGQTLLIIEAMKTMNQIPSPRAGTVKRILVEDGDPVEFGAPLFIIA